MRSPRHHNPRTISTAVLAAGMSLAAALSGCGSGVSTDDSTTDHPGFPLEITTCGDPVRIPEPPERIVALSPSQTELVVRLGLSDRLVGQAQNDSHQLPTTIADEVREVPILAADSPPSRETLLASQPDFVFAPTSFEFSAENGFASVDQIIEAGAAPYIAAGGCFDRRREGTVEDVFTDIDVLGQIFGVDEAAREVRGDAQRRLAAVTDDVHDLPAPKVAQLYVEANTISAIAGGVEFDVIHRAGGDSVYRPDEPAFARSPWATVSVEDIAAREPEAIVFAVTSAANERQVRDYLHRHLAETPAVRDNRLIAVPAADLSPGAIGNIAAVETVAAALHR